MKKAFVFDFDDTLATTEAVVRVKGMAACCVGVSFELTPSEFNDYQLKKGEVFDFSDFRCPNLVENGKPTNLIQLAKDVYDEDHSVYILTARSGDMADAIAKFLKMQGIEAKQIICVGDKDKTTGIANDKKRALRMIMMAYDKIYFYDDNETNVELAQSIGVKSYLIGSNTQ
jgi:FMN phosphatase YigB (HAD superfamily)